MKSSSAFRVVLTTCGTPAEARRIAGKILQQRLAACITIVPGPVESFYVWKGKREHAREVLVLMKTTAQRLKQLERLVLSMHSYDVPEFLVLPVVAGSKPYLDWLAAGASRRKRP